MIAEVIYSHPIPIGTILSCVFGMLIGVGLFTGTIIQIKRKTIKTTLSVIFILLSIAIIIASIISLSKA